MSRVLPVLPVLPQPGRWEYENVVAFAVMRMLALTVLVVLSSAVAQVPQSLPQAGRTTNEGTLNIKVDAQTQKPHTSPFAEYVGVISELVRAVAWPLLFGTLIITQRRPLGRLLEALTELVNHSNHIKFGDMIDVEVDRSAREAQGRDVPTVEVPPNEIKAAAKVGRMADTSDLSTIRARMLEFAGEYEATRSNMKPGSDRTRAMSAIVAKMRTLGIAATPLLPDLVSEKNSPGKRLAALAILQLAPDLAYLHWVVERMSSEQPFILFHSSQVLLAMVRNYGPQSRKELAAAVKRSLDTVQSFAGGPPDIVTIQVLELARLELGGF